MKALEFETSLSPNNTLHVPPNLAAQIPKEKPVQVIVLFPEPSDAAEERDWRSLTHEQFLKGYSEGDSIYDSL